MQLGRGKLTPRSNLAARHSRPRRFQGAADGQSHRNSRCASGESVRRFCAPSFPVESRADSSRRRSRQGYGQAHRAGRSRQAGCDETTRGHDQDQRAYDRAEEEQALSSLLDDKGLVEGITLYYYTKKCVGNTHGRPRTARDQCLRRDSLTFFLPLPMTGMPLESSRTSPPAPFLPPFLRPFSPRMRAGCSRVEQNRHQRRLGGENSADDSPANRHR